MGEEAESPSLSPPSRLGERGSPGDRRTKPRCVSKRWRIAQNCPGCIPNENRHRVIGLLAGWATTPTWSTDQGIHARCSHRAFHNCTPETMCDNQRRQHEFLGNRRTIRMPPLFLRPLHGGYTKFWLNQQRHGPHLRWPYSPCRIQESRSWTFPGDNTRLEELRKHGRFGDNIDTNK
jgi:hypothetical protein